MSRFLYWLNWPFAHPDGPSRARYKNVTPDKNVSVNALAHAPTAPRAVVGTRSVPKFGVPTRGHQSIASE